MKKVLYIIFILPVLAAGQTPDSLDIRIGKTGTRIARPTAGEQTTIRMKDSLSAIEIKVSSLELPASSVIRDTVIKRNTLKLFSEISSGTLIAEDFGSDYISFDMYGMDYYSINYIKIRPGIQAGISILKNSYQIAPSLYLDAGLDYRLLLFGADAIYETRSYEYYVDSSNPNPITLSKSNFHDSTQVNIRKTLNQLSIPLMLRYNFTDAISISFGTAIDFSFEKTRIRYNSVNLDAELFKEMELAENDYPRVQVRPQIRIGLGPVNIQVSRDLKASTYGYGVADKKQTKFTHIGVSYSLF